MRISKYVRDIEVWDQIVIDKQLVKVISIERNPDLLSRESFDVTYTNGRYTDTISLYGDMIVKQEVAN